MSNTRKLWRLLPSQPDLQEELMRKLHIPGIIARLLINRGLTDERAAKQFLSATADCIADPYLLKDMNRAVKRIAAAVHKQEPIVIYGDYDVDGVTASALLYHTFGLLGVSKQHLSHYIPDRQTEGYGLHADVLAALQQAGCSLLITVDCGISAVKEVSMFQEHMDIIITDHHQPPPLSPPAYAVINPKQPECLYPDKNLAGVGVAYKLCQALWTHFHSTDALLLDFIDLVAVGTIADVVPLIGENRALVKLGLEKLSSADANLGLRALLESCCLTNQPIDTGKVGFIIGPRLNAAGRVGHADCGFTLLTTTDETQAKTLAEQLETDNQQRQSIEKQILAVINYELAKLDMEQEPVLVLAGEDWHPGVIGIVASRLVDKYYKPAVVISIQNGVGKGSCRSIAGFDLHAALTQCADLLIQFGGHSQAAGLSIEPDKIDQLRRRLAAIITTALSPDDFIPVLTIDSLLSLEEADQTLLQQLTLLEPYGAGNPAPIFACANLRLEQIKPLGQEGQHLKMRVGFGQTAAEVVAWRMGGLLPQLQTGAAIDLAFFPELHAWQGQETIQLRAHDIKPVDAASLLPNHIHVEDWRNTPSKIEAVLSVLANNRKTLILVNSQQQAISLMQALTATVDCPDKIPDSNRISPEQIIQQFQTGQWQTLIVAEPIQAEVLPPDIRQLIFWDLPLSREILRQQCGQLCRDQQPGWIYLLFGKTDAEAACAMISDKTPTRNSVGKIYLTVSKNAGNDQLCYDTNEQIVQKIHKNYSVLLTDACVQIALTILTELKLLLVQENNAIGRVLQLLPQPVNKLDIRSSPTYSAGMSTYRDAVEMARLVDHADTASFLSRAFSVL